MRKRLFLLLFPGGFLVTAAMAACWRLDLHPWSKAILVFSAAVLVAGCILGWRFNRSKVVFAQLGLTLAWAVQTDIFPAPITAKLPARVFHSAIAMLVALDFCLLACIRERGLFSRHGGIRLGLGLLQIGLLVGLQLWPHPQVMAALEGGFFPWQFERLYLTLPAVMIIAASALLLVFVALRGADVMAATLFWALLGMFAALSWVRDFPATTLIYGASGLALVAGLLEQSYRLAFRDELTGLPGRRALNEFCLRLGKRYAIAMVDVDHFKKFNDRFGHETGDQVLRMVAAHLARVGGGGRPFRYGGEEFTLVFPGKGTREVLPHLEEVRRTLASNQFIIRGRHRPRQRPVKPKPPAGSRRGVKVTVSIGVAERSRVNSSPEQVIEAADQALYRAKRGGRNRVCVLEQV